ncbi:hypothetical protein FUAX_02330 [Fulvitalea axinellae]|uniref:Ig-like domain-containing protein n=2 Tax=Fulvitalea axinellae TaxID=1182444 RepID=A0AAU9CGA9_9BACT|nr:hypothetical protein FUAX_02330 [Fulvitalea axinellae]
MYRFCFLALLFLLFRGTAIAQTTLTNCHPDDLATLQAILEMQELQNEEDRSKLPWTIDAAQGTFQTTDGTNTVEWDEEKSPLRIKKLSVGSKKLKGSLDLHKLTALTSLVCYDNQLTDLNLNGCASLLDVKCMYNQLTSIDLGGCKALQELYCNRNQFPSLTLSETSGLLILNCDENRQLKTLDLSGCKALKELTCTNTQVETLDLSNNPALLIAKCYHNKLTNLNLSANAALEQLHCYSNQLESLDLSDNPALVELRCSSNKLTELDLSANIALEQLYCYNNQFAYLDLSEVPTLKRLECSSNQLTKLDLSQNKALTHVYCSKNQLTSLKGSPPLNTLTCTENQLTDLDLSNSPNLSKLNCSKNQLTVLDLSKNTNMRRLDCTDNHLSSLNLTTMENLWEPKLSKNRLSFESFQTPGYSKWDREFTHIYPQFQVRLTENPFLTTGETIDLSSQKEIYGQASNYEWVNNNNEAVAVDTEAEPNDEAPVRQIETGKFQFKQEGIYKCRISNNALRTWGGFRDQFIETEPYTVGQTTITWKLPASITYGEQLTLEASTNSSSKINFEQIISENSSQIEGTVLHAKEAGLITIRATLESAGDYNALTIEKQILVKPKALTISPDKQIKEVGKDDPELTYTQEGLINGDKITGNLVREEGEETGTYKILVGTLDAGKNYKMELKEVLFTIAKLLDVEKEHRISFAPNPVQDQLRLQGLTAGSNVELVNLSGTVIKKTVAESGSHVFNCSDLTKGMYLLRIDGKSIQKIIKR